MLTHFSLFSGIGGFDLAAEWAGFTNVGQCEIADFPTQVLEKHWPDVPRWRDIRDVTADSVRSAGIGRITVISGGFPCQPWSVAGKRRGAGDDRHLWPEMLRVIDELRPDWVLGENVSGLLAMGLDAVLSDLEGAGYATQTFCVPACAVDAPHRRDRLWIVAHSAGGERDAGAEVAGTLCAVHGNGRKHDHADGPSADVADADGQRPQGRVQRGERPGQRTAGPCRWPDERDWFAPSRVRRISHGVPQRVDRLKALGNAIVPQVACEFFRTISDVQNTPQ